QQIIGFYQLVRLESFTKAAEATFRTQSALSQQLKALEEELGCLLIERIGNRKLRLTSKGEKFFRFAEEVLEKYESLTESLHDLQAIQRGTLSVAAPFTTLYHLFPEIFRKYIAQYPQVQLSILDRPQKAVIELVKSGGVDFGFVLESVAPSNLVSWRWKKVNTVLMVPSGHPLASLTPVNFEDVSRYPLILGARLTHETGHVDILQRLQSLCLSYSVVMESSNVDLSSVYVEMGLGVSFATIVEGLPVLKKRKIEFLSLDHHFEPGRLVVVTRKSFVPTSYKKSFLELLLKGT
ncbi:MAG: LysR family transcriptional regulator, partial [Desulfomonilaceae bacterium]